jgi:hypothetical protein
MVVDDVVVLFGAAIFENGGLGKKAFMLRVHAFRLMGVISRLGYGEGLRDCEYCDGRGRWCVINANHRIVWCCCLRGVRLRLILGGPICCRVQG